MRLFIPGIKPGKDDMSGENPVKKMLKNPIRCVFL